MDPVKLSRVQPLLRWHGSKWRLAKLIISEFPRGYEATKYVEVFGGSAAILACKQPSRSEVYNDLDEELVNFWRQVQFHPVELARILRQIPFSASLFAQWRKSRTAQPTELLRAAVYCFCSLASFNGLMGTFERRVVPRPHELNYIKRKIMRMAARMRGVVVENMECEKVIDFYYSPHTLFYADPPYPGHAAYRVKFSQSDFERLVERLRGIKGKALLSISHEQRPLLKGFRIRDVHMRYTVKGGRPGPRLELLAMNW